MEDQTFDQRVYQLVGRIPAGKVSTYGQIALLLGNPGWARRVGKALSRCPADCRVPCHRVVNCQGRPAPGWAEQRELLRREGVWRDGRETVDLKRFLWRPLQRHD